MTNQVLPSSQSIYNLYAEVEVFQGLSSNCHNSTVITFQYSLYSLAGRTLCLPFITKVCVSLFEAFFANLFPVVWTYGDSHFGERPFNGASVGHCCKVLPPSIPEFDLP